MGEKSKPNKTSLHVVFGVCAVALAAFYLFEVNSIVKDNFALDRVEREIKELGEKHEGLKVRASEAQSLAALREQSKILGLEEIKNVFYIYIERQKALGLTSL